MLSLLKGGYLEEVPTGRENHQKVQPTNLLTHTDEARRMSGV